MRKVENHWSKGIVTPVCKSPVTAGSSYSEHCRRRCSNIPRAMGGMVHADTPLWAIWSLRPSPNQNGCARSTNLIWLSPVSKCVITRIRLRVGMAPTRFQKVETAVTCVLGEGSEVPSHQP